MEEHGAVHEDTGNSADIGRRTLLTTGAKLAGGLIAGGVLVGHAPGTAWAERAQAKNLQVMRAGTVTLSVMTDVGPAEVALYKARAQVFEAQNPNIKINFIVVSAPGGWAQFAEKVITVIAGGNVPDIFRIATEAAQLFGAKDLLLPLNDYIKRDGAAMEPFYKGVNPALIQNFNYKGEQLGLPFDWETEGIVYNTALFQKYGIKPPAANWTTDDFLSVAKKLKSEGVYAFNLPGGGTFALVAWMYAAGGSLLSPDLKKSNATDPANVAALQFLQDLVYKYKVSPQPSGGLQDFPLLEAGRVGMVEDGRWAVATFNQAKFKTYDTQYLPRFGSAKRKCILGIGSFAVYKKTPHPEEAWKWVKFITSRESSLFFVQSGQGISPWRDIAQNGHVMVPPANYSMYYNSSAPGVGQPLPAPPQYNQTDAALTAVYTKVMANEMSAAEAMKQLDKQLATILAQPA